MAFFNRQKHSVPAEIQLPRLLLVVAVVLLTLIGLMMVYSVSSVDQLSEWYDSMYYPDPEDPGVVEPEPFADVISQALLAVAGMGIAVALWKFLSYRIWVGNFVWIIWVVCIVLIVLTALVGKEQNGAKRWLFVFQPSELIKVGLLLVAIRILYDYKNSVVEGRATRSLVIALAVTLFSLYYLQSDLGTTLICVAGIFAVMYLGGVSGKVLLVIIGVGVAFVLFAIFGSDYRADRLSFLNPWDDGEDGYGSGFNLIRSLYAIAEGGVFGVGIGNSHEKFQYLFASESDFIFAVVCEELGLIGALTVLVLFVVILLAGLRIASQATDEMGALVAGGCTVMLVAQAFLNIGCAIGILPTTGKPLPFISSGGSSLLATFIMIGLILSVSQEAGGPSVYEQRRADLRIVRANQNAGGSRTGRSERAGDADRGFSRPAGRSGSADRARRGTQRRVAGDSRASGGRATVMRFNRASVRPSSDFSRLEMPRGTRR